MIVLLFYLENHIARNKKDNLTKKKDKKQSWITTYFVVFFVHYKFRQQINFQNFIQKIKIWTCSGTHLPLNPLMRKTSNSILPREVSLPRLSASNTSMLVSKLSNYYFTYVLFSRVGRFLSSYHLAYALFSRVGRLFTFSLFPNSTRVGKFDRS